MRCLRGKPGLADELQPDSRGARRVKQDSIDFIAFQ
jgi:hypothetical protein